MRDVKIRVLNYYFLKDLHEVQITLFEKNLYWVSFCIAKHAQKQKSDIFFCG